MVAKEKTDSTRKRRHVSKKNKISWRKNVDIQDVEDFLEDQRLEERLGTPFAEKADSELFVIDTQPSARSTRGKARETGEAEKRLTARQRKQLALPEVPACFQALVNTSKVNDPSGKRNHVRPVKLSEKTELKKVRKGIYKKKFEAAQKNRALERRRKTDLKEYRHSITKDLWGSQDVVPVLPAPPSEWLSRDTRDCNKPLIRPKRPTRKAPRAMAVVVPHPGTSYNPNFKDHQELLQEVVRQETVVMKEERHLNRVTSGMFRKVTAKQMMEEDMKELRQGLEEAGRAAEPEEDDGKHISSNPPALNKKRDLKKRRHMREERLLKATKAEALKEKKKLAAVYKLKFIQRDMTETEKRQAKERENRTRKRKEAPPMPRLTAVGYQEPAPDFPEVAELSGNLRNLVPKGAGLTERMVSLQRRGLAPVSSMRTLRAAKKKRYTLASHKLPWEITEGPAKPSKRK